ncbi:unnamed protein product [Heligmosomoides polygyrus]|uniref:DUF1794 domain-containing protein n=1 Tax=Heligmosomoides polygyrus TaxID=6339 RepID=A0A183GPY2_HELPZ|nr:unnamed protein product [Heligmosomoides polygyrus]
MWSKFVLLIAAAADVFSVFAEEYDLRRLPSQLKPLAFLVGKWRSDHGGKAVFATIPTFTYGEEVDISIPDSRSRPLPALNFTSRAWSVNNPDEELHSESGYISVDPRTGTAALTTTMNNGFVTAEEGLIKGTKIKFRLIDVGRMSFSHDLPVVDVS